MKMRAGLVLVMILGFFASPSFAQRIAFGPKIGVNVTTIDTNEPDIEQLDDAKAGLAVGGFVDIGITNRFSIQPEVLYSQRGGKGRITEEGETFDATLTLDYVEIPILAKFNFAATGRVRPFVFTGPVPAFNTRAKVKGEAVVEGTDVDVEEDIDEEVKGGDFGWVLGGGVEIRGFTIDVRYNWGLVDINEDPADIEGQVKNRAFSVLFGYRWGRR
jgi:outer membrane protein with beta-barrel domain